MSLFFDVLQSINDPNRQGSVSQLESVTNSIQQLAAKQGISTAQTQSLVSALGSGLRPVLQQQSLAGKGSLENMLGQAMGAAGGMGALQSFLSPQLQQQLVQVVAQKTGLSTNMLQSMLPTLLPAVMGLLNMGASKTGGIGSNPLLGAFLDSDRDGDTDLGDVFKFAGRFLNPSPL
jgi:hypothetical protein